MSAHVSTLTEVAASPQNNQSLVAPFYSIERRR